MSLRRQSQSSRRLATRAASVPLLLLALALATGCDARFASRSHHETTVHADLGVDASTVENDASVAPDLGPVEAPDAQIEVDLGPVIPPDCGDGVVGGVEQCDDGLNATPYWPVMTTAACGPTCQYPHYCGDGIVDPAFDEQCDDGNDICFDFCNCSCLINPAWMP